MQISKEKIENLANQIYLGLTEQELENLPNDIQKIVDAASLLQEVDTTDVKLDVAVLKNYNVFREDIVEPYEQIQEGNFKLPKIM